jgi:hypothetical protein
MKARGRPHFLKGSLLVALVLSLAFSVYLREVLCSVLLLQLLAPNNKGSIFRCQK